MKPSARYVLDLLRSRADEGLTSLEALRLGGGFRLPARIAELKADGYPIEKRMVRVDGTYVARYVLREERAA